MRSTTDKQVSAQVLLRSRSGARPSQGPPITAANLSQWQPDPAAADAATAAFARAGFEVGPLVGISFSITAPLSRFVQFFGADVRVNAQGLTAVHGRGRSTLELPLKSLPGELAAHLDTVTFSEPAELFF